MTTEQPDALRYAHKLRDMSAKFKAPSHERGVCNGAIEVLRTQHAEIERLNAAATDSNLILERAQAANLEMLAEIERKDALLRQALEALEKYIAWCDAESDGKVDFWERVQMCRDSEAAARAALESKHGL